MVFFKHLFLWSKEIRSFSVRRLNTNSNKSNNIWPGIGRRIGEQTNNVDLVPIRFTSQTDSLPTNSSSNGPQKTSILTRPDIEVQKEHKFRQIIEQPTVDLSKKNKSIYLASTFFLSQTRWTSKSQLERNSETTPGWSLEITLCKNRIICFSIFTKKIFSPFLISGLFAAESRTPTWYTNKETRWILVFCQSILSKSSRSRTSRYFSTGKVESLRKLILIRQTFSSDYE